MHGGLGAAAGVIHVLGPRWITWSACSDRHDPKRGRGDNHVVGRGRAAAVREERFWAAGGATPAGNHVAAPGSPIFARFMTSRSAWSGEAPFS